MSLFSKNLRFLRKKGNLNQDEISALFNKRANTIGNWENQKSEPSLVELMKLGEYFHVSTQSLLQSDLEKESMMIEQKTTIPLNTEPTGKSYPLQESFPAVVRETDADAFWLILRELRAVNEKLDLLSAGSHISTEKMKSDKSSH
jgi:transcriptional regulator with XRE-family HTH domain